MNSRWKWTKDTVKHSFHFLHVHLAIWCQDMSSPRGKEQALVVSHAQINHIWNRRWLWRTFMFRHWPTNECFKRMHINRCFFHCCYTDFQTDLTLKVIYGAVLMDKADKERWEHPSPQARYNQGLLNMWSHALGVLQLLHFSSRLKSEKSLHIWRIFLTIES